MPDLPSSLIAFAPISGIDSTGTVGGLLLYITVALGFSFLCSILEAVLLSASLSHVELLAQDGSRAGLLMQKHKANVERPISAILTLNTIAHTVGAAGAGAQAVGVFGNEWLGVISAVLTLLILVLSEIIPKTLGAVYWKQLTPLAAYSIQFLIILLYPAVWTFELLTRLMRPDEESPTVTRSELAVMAQISADEGTLLEPETRTLRNLLELNKVQVKDVMTPRTVVFALQQETPVTEVVSQHPTLDYSRIPIYSEDADDIIAFALRHDIYKRAANGDSATTLKDLARDIRVIPETNTIAQALDAFISQQTHIFLVIDEYGGTAGIITMEDAIETLLGIEITDESDTVADLRKLAEQRYNRQLRLVNDFTEQSANNPQTDQPTSAS